MGKRKKRAEPLELLRKLVQQKEPAQKNRFIEYSRSSSTGKRILRQKVVPKKVYKKRVKQTITSSTTTNNNDEIGSHELVTADDGPADTEINLVDDLENSGKQVDYVHKQDYNQAISNCVQLLQKLIKTPKRYKRKSWNERISTSNMQWQRTRPIIWDSLLSREVVSGDCDVCHDRDAVITCSSCSSCNLCHICDDIVHSSSPLHDRSFYGYGYQCKLTPLEIISDQNQIEPTVKYPNLKHPKCEYCSSNNLLKRPSDDMCVVITLRGRFDLFKYTVYCESCLKSFNPFDLEYIMNSGYWPGSPIKISCLIKEEVFQLWDAFRKRMPGSSQKSFIMSLCDTSEMNGRNGNIIPNTFQQAFKEWNYWQYEKDLLQGKNWMKCPSCAVNQHSCHVDGNCKLYRYKSAGTSKRSQYYAGTFFTENVEVENYLQKLYGEQRGLTKLTDVNNQCGGIWTAARNIKRKANSLDETGIDVASCRHRIGQKAVNMFQGELFGYPVFLMKTFMISNQVKYCFSDVMCKLWKFVKRHEPSVAQLMTPALSVMHAKGHAFDCQVLWSGEWTNGTGKSTGEETGQVFSFLSRCGNTTKHETPENRMETITEMMMWWNKRKIINLAKDLKRRHSKNESDLKIVQVKIKDAIQSTGLTMFEKEVHNWVQEIKLGALSVRCSTTHLLTRDEKLLLLMHDHGDPLSFNLSPGLLTKINFPKTFKATSYYQFLDFEKQDKADELRRLISLEQPTPESIAKSHDSLRKNVWVPMFKNLIEKRVMEKIYWGATIKQVADTSKRRHVLRTKLGATTKMLKDLVFGYCAVCGVGSQNDVYQSCENGCFPWNLQERHQQDGTAANRRYCAELYLKRCRLVEERSLLITDIKSYFTFYYLQTKELREKLQLIIQEIKSESKCDEMIDDSGDALLRNETYPANLRGKIALIKKGLAFCHCAINAGTVNCRNILGGNLPRLHDSDVESDDETSENEYGSTNLSENESGSEVPEEIRNGESMEVSFATILNAGQELAVEYYNQPTFECRGKTVHWLMPSSCCQSELAGANGSNACVIIALLMGYALRKSKIMQKDMQSKDFVNSFLPLFCGAIDIGNCLYELNELSGFLHVVQAMNVIPTGVAISITNEHNVFFNKTGMLSIVSFLQQHRVEQARNSFCVIVSCGKAMLLFLDEYEILFVDSHKSGEHGGRFSIFKSTNPPEQLLQYMPCINDDDVIYVCFVDVNCMI